jgi:hypothetical protein
MARNFDGVFRPGNNAAAGRGGTASTTTSSGPSAMASLPNFSSPTALPVVANSRSSWPSWIEAP